MKKCFLFIIVVFLIINCKTIQTKTRETTGKIVFKNLLNKAEKINDVYILGALKISGVKEIPQAYIKFESTGNLKTKNSFFRISLLKKPILDILFETDKILLVNYTANQYIYFNLEDVNLSKLFGININPTEISYFLLGNIPYTDDMQLMTFKIEKNKYYLELTNNSSKYDIILNENEEIINAKSSNQFFDDIILESIKYTKNDDNINIPKYVVFSSTNEEKKVALSFLISNISYKKSNMLFDKNIINDFEEIFDINKIKVKIK